MISVNSLETSKGRILLLRVSKEVRYNFEIITANFNYNIYIDVLAAYDDGDACCGTNGDHDGDDDDDDENAGEDLLQFADQLT